MESAPCSNRWAGRTMPTVQCLTKERDYWVGSSLSVTAQSRWPFFSVTARKRSNEAWYAAMNLDSKIPQGPLAQKWDKHKFDLKLINPANKRKFDIIVVGSGLAGASAAASLAELGYKVKCFCFQD